MKDLLPLCDWQEVHRRLPLVFPEGLENRNYLTREIAAKSIFVMLYVGAVAGADVWLRPDQVTRMTDEQAKRGDEQSRRQWATTSCRPKRESVMGRWYAQNTREPIRDETLRQGLVKHGAVVERTELPTTSPKGRYALTESFAKLMSLNFAGENLDIAIQDWRDSHLSQGALARITLLRNATVETSSGILVTYPNGETRRMAAGPSSLILKAVIEEFAPRFLEHPGVLWLSESAKKEDSRDLHLMKLLQLEIETDKNLPDLILVDLGSEEPIFVFVEAVASDGAVTEERRQALLKIISKGGYTEKQVVFLTAFLDRASLAFRQHFPNLAWETFVWTVSEPEKLISLCCDLKNTKIRNLIGP